MDEDSQARTQLNVLRADGRDVVAIGELKKNGAPDSEVFDLAQTLDRVLLTHNSADFEVMQPSRKLGGRKIDISVPRGTGSPSFVGTMEENSHFLRRNVSH